MRIGITQSLFPWDALEDSPSIKTLRLFLDSIPDAKLLDGLRYARGKGRNDHPVSTLWGVVLLTIALRHVTFEACLDELRRNQDLRCEWHCPAQLLLHRPVAPTKHYMYNSAYIIPLRAALGSCPTGHSGLLPVLGAHE